MPGIALFDVDGVLVKGFTMLSFGRLMFRRGLVPRGRWLKVVADYTDYKAGAISYARFASASVADFALALAGLSRAEVLRTADLLFEEWARPYWYSSSLVRLFQGQGMLTVAISGSLEECLRPLQARLGLDEFYGTVLELDSEGDYTGRVSRNLALQPSKEAMVRALRRRADFSNSFAFGDTGQDLPILERVAHPVAMNAKEELRRVAAGRGWRLISYRHDVLKQVRELLG